MARKLTTVHDLNDDDRAMFDRPCVQLMLIGSPVHRHLCGACAEVCAACTASCEAVGDMDDCVRACRACEETCRKMAA